MRPIRLDARWVVPVEPAGALPRHSVVVRGDRIEAVLPTPEAATAYPEAEVVDLAGQALIPGLVNAHTHAAMTLLRGWADDLRLMDWLQTRIWPTEARFVDSEFVADGTRLACLEMALGGTTMFNDMYFFQSDAIAASVDSGVRIVSGITYVAAPTRYASSEEEYVERGMAAWHDWHEHSLVRFSLAPHSTYATDPGSWARLRPMVTDLGLGVHTHVNETVGEVERQLEAHGAPVVQWLADQGYLAPGFVGAHAVHMTPAEIELLASSGSAVAHCPSSNLKLASGFAPVWDLLQAGVTVALGTDGAASNNRLDMWQEMRTAALLAKAVSGDGAAVSAEQALRMATLSGAEALGRGDDLGSITPGKLADLVSVDLTSPLAHPNYDPVSHLVYVASRTDVRDVWVHGTQIIADGVSQTVDVSALLHRVDAWWRALTATK